jgi:hypothetical protein
MKKTITLFLGLLTFATEAQYNNTYDVNANTDNLTPAFVITNKKAESITVSYASDGPSTPRTDYFILTKHDAVGNVIYNNRMDPINATNDGLTHVEALIETDDEGVLVAGYHYDDANFVEQPFLLKVDVNGNFQWARIYYVNQKPIAKSAINKISLCRVFNDRAENYFIVASGDSDANPGQDVATNVIKVDAAGNMLFSKKYYDANPSFVVTREYPGDIEFSKPDQLFMITGFRQDATQFVKRGLMYFFGIDNNGNVITKFLTLASKSIPLDEDMVYDPNKNVFAVTFTHEKNGYVTGTSSVMGFLTIDANLLVANTKYLWHKEASEHNSRSISLSNTGDYLICSGVYDNSFVFVHNPAWLKVDASGSPVSALLRYNVKDDVYFGHHATTFDPNTGSEEFVLVNEHKTDLRMIRTAFNGKACGVMKFEPFVKEYEPKAETYKYYDKEQGDYTRYKVYEKLFFPDYRKCDGDGSSYRTTGIVQVGTTTNEGTTSLYPTVITAGNAYLMVENNSGTEVNMEVRNITGQLVFANKHISSGKTEMNVNPNGELSVGIYLVNIYTTEGVLTSTSKILVSE